MKSRQLSIKSYEVLELLLYSIKQLYWNMLFKMWAILQFIGINDKYKNFTYFVEEIFTFRSCDLYQAKKLLNNTYTMA